MASAIGIRGPNSPLASTHVVASHNPIQLAAISNYKLAQLTFAPPDLHSLRKTAVIKNMLDDVYNSTPTEWLQQMTRWQYFTPESLEEMTQEGLEEIFNQYAQTIEAFRPVKSINPYQDDDYFDEDDDGQGDDLWIAEDEQDLLPPPPPPPPVHMSIDGHTEQSLQHKTSSIESIFSQPNATISNESMGPLSKLSEKPLPAKPTIINEDKQTKRKSGFTGNINRLSWTSDTGVTSSAVSQHLANELMNLFDMDFAVDIKVNTAPKLPELPFKPKRKSQQRQSQDMLTSLLPAFDKIALENSPHHKPSLTIKAVPQRSSSLRHRQELQIENTKLQSPVQSPLTPPLTPDHIEKSASKKKSILRLASLMTGKKHHKHHKEQSPYSSESLLTSTIEQQQQQQQQSPLNTPRKASTSTVDSISSSSSTSSWSSISENGDSIQIATRAQKPLPATPNEQQQEKSHRSSKKKKESMKRPSNQGLSSIYDETEDSHLSRSKSAFIKIGNGLKSKKQLKQIRRTSSAKNLSEYENEHASSENNIYHSVDALNSVDIQNGFVKKVTSFNWRIKPRNKTVEV